MIELQLLRISLHFHSFLGANTTFHLRTLPDFQFSKNPRPELLHTNLSISIMAEPSTLIPNLNEIVEEHTQPEGEVHLEPTEEVHLEPTEENRTSEQPEVRPVARQQKRKGKERRQEEEEEDEFVSEEAYSAWKKHYAGRGFVGERGFSQLISPFKELIEQRGWGKFCKHYKTGYAAIVREFYSNLVGRKENFVFVRGVWVPYGVETINAIYRMEGQKHGSKYKRLADSPNKEKIARRLTNGKVKWG